MESLERRMKAHNLHAKLNDSTKVLGCNYMVRRHMIDEHPDCKQAIHGDLARQIGTGLAEQGFVEFGKHTSEKDQNWEGRESPFDDVVITAEVVVMSRSDYLEIMRLSNELAR